MKIAGIDHLVLTTNDLARCLDFYAGVLGELGIEHRVAGERHELYFGGQKINIHTRPGEFWPAAGKPAAGSLDICLEVEAASAAELVEYLRDRGAAIETGPVTRRGARGEMESVYLRDPDGNLVELAVYSE